MAPIAVQPIQLDGFLAYAAGDYVHPDNVELHGLQDYVDPDPEPELVPQEELESMPYHELQAYAKQRGVPANQSRDALVAALA